jgi:hypothetical protein
MRRIIRELADWRGDAAGRVEADAKWLSWLIRTADDKRLAGCDWQRRQSRQKGDARQPYFELTARRWNMWAECYLTSKELRQSFGSAMHLAAGKCNRALFHPPKAVPVIFAILQTRWTTVTSACKRRKKPTLASPASHLKGHRISFSIGAVLRSNRISRALNYFPPIIPTSIMRRIFRVSSFTRTTSSLYPPINIFS